jgi:subtilase-type serine protease
VANQWSYPGDPGFVAPSPAYLDAAKASWETAEYKRSWGLTAQKASTAYALGYYGQGVTVGIMDSGVQAEHMEFQGGRFIPVVQQGVYGTSGYRYRDTRPEHRGKRQPRDRPIVARALARRVSLHREPFITS